MAFFNALPGAVAEGLIWGLMAIGVYISYKVLDIADLTVDGSICTGACVCAVLITGGVPAWLSVLIAFLAGAATGICTGLFHTALGIPSILAGTLIAAIIIALWLFIYTEVGLTIKSTGDNPDMSRAQGVDVNFNKVLGLAISNGIVAVSGALLAQYKGSASINDGRGAIVIGLAAIFIGLSVSMKIKPNFVVSLIGVIFGGIVYYIIYNFVVLLGLKTDYLKMLSAIIVVIFLAVPYLKNQYFKKQPPMDIQAMIENNGGGNADA